MNLPPYRPGNRLITGSTQCGKSFAEVIEIIISALCVGMGILCVDPHSYSLAYNTFKHLVARGQTHRILFDRLSSFSRVLGYQFLRRSTATNPFRREAENDQTAKELLDVLLRRRDVQSLASNPLTEEFVTDALLLVIHQDSDVPASHIRYAFQPQADEFQKLVAHCTNETVRQKFLAIADGRIKPGMYASASRLIRSVCTAAFNIRCNTTFDLGGFLDDGGILFVEGGTDAISQDAANTIMGGIVLQMLHHARSRRIAKNRLLLVLDEATNANLIGAAGHEVRAMAELQKRKLDVHVLCQSPSFPNSFIEDAIYTNCIEHHWFFAANDAVARKAAADLGDASYRERVRQLRRGERFIKRLSRVEFSRVQGLPDPWAYPKLMDRKARSALKKILSRPEYWSPKCNDSQSPNTSRPSNESSPSLNNMSSSSSKSSGISAAERLRIAKSIASGNNDNSEPSEK